MENKNIKIEKIKAEILEQAKKALEECKKSTSKTKWETFKTKMNGIYRSYAYCTNPDYVEAMSSILTSKPIKGLEEIYNGNYSFIALAYKQPEFKQELDTLKMLEGANEKEIKTYLESMNKCHNVVFNHKMTQNAKINESFDNLSKRVAHSVINNPIY